MVVLYSVKLGGTTTIGAMVVFGVGALVGTSGADVVLITLGWNVSLGRTLGCIVSLGIPTLGCIVSLGITLGCIVSLGTIVVGTGVMTTPGLGPSVVDGDTTGNLVGRPVQPHNSGMVDDRIEEHSDNENWASEPRISIRIQVKSSVINGTVFAGTVINAPVITSPSLHILHDRNPIFDGCSTVVGVPMTGNVVGVGDDNIATGIVDPTGADVPVIAWSAGRNDALDIPTGARVGASVCARAPSFCVNTTTIVIITNNDIADTVPNDDEDDRVARIFLIQLLLLMMVPEIVVAIILALLLLCCCWLFANHASRRKLG